MHFSATFTQKENYLNVTLKKSFWILNQMITFAERFAWFLF
jgi:hypothetical protein